MALSIAVAGLDIGMNAAAAFVHCEVNAKAQAGVEDEMYSMDGLMLIRGARSTAEHLLDKFVRADGTTATIARETAVFAREQA